MNYKETIDYLFSQLPMYHRIGAAAYKADLGNTVALCTRLGDPQNSFPSVHIAGTNGKGSVSHMLASIMQNCGLKTGLYTSPHLKDFRERIRVNGEMITEEAVVAFVKRYRSDFETIQPSFFEMTVGMAFDFFRQQKVDIAIIEVGLGGRLDSTNIITPLVSVITNVSFDHMQLLGDTLEKIAFEKAGIIKPGIPVVVGETQNPIREVFTKRAAEVGTGITFADSIYTVLNTQLTSDQPKQLVMDIHRNGFPFLKRLSSPLSGLYQLKNIVTVIGACEALNAIGMQISPAMMRTGIGDVVRNTGFAGRWQLLGENPLTLCDTGHNEEGLREVLTQIAQTPHQTLHFVFGVVNDKSISHILEMLPRNAIYYFCKADIPRGLDAGELQVRALAAGVDGKKYDSVKAALEAARQAASPEDLVFVGGSTFVVAEVI